MNQEDRLHFTPRTQDLAVNGDLPADRSASGLHGAGELFDVGSAGSPRPESGLVRMVPRPPCLPPRRRRIALWTRARLCEWTRLALGLNQAARINVEEWVATDSRLTPHIVQITVETHGRSITIEQASERICIGDVFAAFLATLPLR